MIDSVVDPDLAKKLHNDRLQKEKTHWDEISAEEGDRKEREKAQKLNDGLNPYLNSLLGETDESFPRLADVEEMITVA